MSKKNIILIGGILFAVLAILLILLKGNPDNVVNLNSVMQIAEGFLHHVDKTGQVLTSISDEEEARIGDRIHDKFMADRVAKNLKGTPLADYVEAVTAKVSENVKRKKILYKVHIIDSYMPNAFSSPGGHIYVTVGLISSLQSEAELAAIIGHEIIHVDAKHAIGSIQYRIKMSKVTGGDPEDYASIGYDIFFRPGYSEVQEKEADIGGVYLAYAAGYHPLAVINAFENVIGADGDFYGNSGSSVTPVGDALLAVAGGGVRYFSTHPLSEERINAIKSYVKENKWVDGNIKYYIGVKNFLEKIPFSQHKYRDEYNALYNVPKRVPQSTAGEPEKFEKVEFEIYTLYGRLYIGMHASEVDRIMPESCVKFKRKDSAGYTGIKIYDFRSYEIYDYANILLGFTDDKLSSIEIVRR